MRLKQIKKIEEGYRINGHDTFYWIYAPEQWLEANCLSVGDIISFHLNWNGDAVYGREHDNDLFFLKEYKITCYNNKPVITINKAFIEKNMLKLKDSVYAYFDKQNRLVLKGAKNES